jgi:hypothetical protein
MQGHRGQGGQQGSNVLAAQECSGVVRCMAMERLPAALQRLLSRVQDLMCRTVRRCPCCVDKQQLVA